MHDAIDPYRIPTSATLEPAADAAPETLVNAGKWRRLGTFLIDYCFRLALIFIAALPFGVFGSDATLARIENITRVEEFVLGTIVLLFYYIVFEAIWGRTPGKWILGTRVIDEQGRKPGFGQVLGRSFARIVPFEALSLLLADDTDPRGWHDRWPRTRVVMTRGQR